MAVSVRDREVVTSDDDTPPLLPGMPGWRILFGLLLTTLAITGLSGLVAYVLSDALEQQRWEASAQIEYRGDAWLETEGEISGSHSRVQPIADLFEIERDEFDKRLTAGEVPGTQIIEYRYQDEVPERALDIVRVLTASYLETQPSSKSEAVIRLEDEVRELTDELDFRKAQLAAVAGPIGSEPGAVERTAETEVARVQTLLGEAQVRLLEAELAVIGEDDQKPELVSAPHVLDEPVAPKPGRRAAFGVLAGLLISALVAASVLSNDRRT